MAPSRAWIIHSFQATPAILTEEDITTASLGKITEFYQGVKTLMLLRLGGLPEDLREDFISRSALDFYGVLYAAVDSGMYRDISWVEEWSHAVTEVSIRMRGYPRELRKADKTSHHHITDTIISVSHYQEREDNRYGPNVPLSQPPQEDSILSVSAS